MYKIKIIALFLLLGIYLYITVGYTCSFFILRYKLKKEIKKLIKSSLSEKDLEVIRINKTELQNIKWKERGKEFVYKNNMYDIVKIENRGDCTVYYCINDKKEKELFSDLDNYVNNNMKKRTISQLFAFNLYVIEDVLTYMIYLVLIIIKLGYIESNYIFENIEDIIHPPQYSFV